MGNISDYVAWRGDISFKVSPFNHIDSLILCQILYADLEQIVPKSFTSKISLCDVGKMYFNNGHHEKKLGALINKDTASLLKSVSEATRYSKIQICALVNTIDTYNDTQFGAMCALLPTGELCVIFKGTDDTLAGWKEDFNMCHTFPIPAHGLALEYLENACSKFNKKTYVMGHSKGGNLSVYASAYANQKTSKKIIAVFDNDGPGFLPEYYNDEAFIKNASRVQTIIPESSIIGILLNRVNKPRYIESSEKSGVSQHDMFTWKLLGTKLQYIDEQSASALVATKTVDTWLNTVAVEDRKEFISELFNVINSTQATTLLELSENWVKCSVTVLRTMNSLDKTTKERIYQIIMHLFHSLHVNLPTLKDFFSHG